MDINKIQRLSKQHKALKEFHRVCNHNTLELTVKHRPYSEASLDSVASESIISGVRGILLDRISDIEKRIKEEASNG